jgi:hypothetical protein
MGARRAARVGDVGRDRRYPRGMCADEQAIVAELVAFALGVVWILGSVAAGAVIRRRAHVQARAILDAATLRALAVEDAAATRARRLVMTAARVAIRIGARDP